MVLLLALTLFAMPQTTGSPRLPAACGADSTRTLAKAADLVAWEDMQAAELLLATQSATDPLCPSLDIARLAVAAWNAARAAAPHGGSRESLALAAVVLKDLDARALRLGSSVPLQYARSLTVAAMAAAQDERPEMELYLVHARSLSDRLPPDVQRWPMSIDEAEGELWFEVDRYEEARLAFTRAAAARRGGRALLGLARSAARLDDRAVACAAYREWLDAARGAREAMEEARKYLSDCR